MKKRPWTDTALDWRTEATAVAAAISNSALCPRREADNRTSGRSSADRPVRAASTRQSPSAEKSRFGCPASIRPYLMMLRKHKRFSFFYNLKTFNENTCNLCNNLFKTRYGIGRTAQAGRRRPKSALFSKKTVFETFWSPIFSSYDRYQQGAILIFAD